MKVDLNTPMTNAYGEEIKDENGKVKMLAELAAELFLTDRDKDKDPIKLAGWGFKLIDGKVLELDKSDAELFKKTILGSTMISMYKSRIIEKCSE